MPRMKVTEANLDEVLSIIKFDAQGYVPAIVVDHRTGQPLMFAYTNRDTLKSTLATGHMHYWSRSRGKAWLKGETSGHTQAVKEVRIDCDGDALLFKVDQAVGACHTGYFSCFFRRLGTEGWVEDGGEKVFDPEQVYRE